MKYIILITGLLLGGFNACAQNSAERQISVLQQQIDSLKGTYKLVSTSRNLPSLPSNLAEIIEKNRSETEFTEVQLNEDVKLIVYPRNRKKEQEGKNEE